MTLTMGLVQPSILLRIWSWTSRPLLQVLKTLWWDMYVSNPPLEDKSSIKYCPQTFESHLHLENLAPTMRNLICKHNICQQIYKLSFVWIFSTCKYTYSKASRMKWNHTLMCFVLDWKATFLEKCMHFGYHNAPHILLLYHIKLTSMCFN